MFSVFVTLETKSQHKVHLAAVLELLVTSDNLPQQMELSDPGIVDADHSFRGKESVLNLHTQHGLYVFMCGATVL